MIRTLTFLDRPLTVRTERVGEDLSVTLSGGSQPHIGGCALASPYTADGRPCASVSSVSLPGHQDAVLAAEAAKLLCKRFSCRVCVSCGIHYDALQPDQLAHLRTMVLDALTEGEIG